MSAVLTVEIFENNLPHIVLFLLCTAVMLLFLLVRKSQQFRQVSERCERLEQQVTQSNQTVEDHIQYRHKVEVENASMKSSNLQLEQQILDNKQKIAALEVIERTHIQLQARFAEKELQIQSQQQLLEESKAHLLKEFELAANKLFESKQRNFQETSRQNVEGVLKPFKDQLLTFHKHVDNLYSKESAQRNQLIGQIGELQKQATKISDDANNLAQALKGDNRVQGQWGEVILERLLEQSGLENGREYSTQISLKSETGKNYRPDVVIHLPENKDIVIDSKVTLVEYERFVNEEGAQEKELHLKGHIESIRNHIRSLSAKNYEKLEGIRSIDFIFMFIPIEAAYTSAIQNSPLLFNEAEKKNIMLVSPSSLMVALRTVETMWRYEKQNANAEKIAASAGKLYDQFVLVVAALEDLGNSLNKANESHALVFNRLSSGRGNLFKRVEDLKKLGAKTTKKFSTASQKRLEEDEDKIELMADED